MPLSDARKTGDMCIRLDTILEYDGRTNRRTDLLKQHRALHT